MKAVVIREPGGVDVLEMRDVETPSPGPDEVRVRVVATAVNRADLLQRQGLYPAPKDVSQVIPGLEYAGEIVECGLRVHEWNVGDRVMGLIGGGSYAEYVTVQTRALSRIPNGYSFEEAAAIPEAFLTAYDALVLQGALRSQDRVLIHAVGSGVGTAAVQIASCWGARVWGTARAETKLERAAHLGMSRGFLGTTFAETMIRENEEVDLVIDLVGGPYVAENLKVLATQGTIIVVGLVGGRQADLDLGSLLRKRAAIRGTVLRSRPLEERIAIHQQLSRVLVPLFETRQLTPVTDQILSISEVAKAHERVASNEPFGKVVLKW